MAAANPHIVYSKLPGGKYFFYHASGFAMNTCNIIYVGQDDFFENFHVTLRKSQCSTRVACMLFDSDTSLEELVNAIEVFTRNTTQDEIKLTMKAFHQIKSANHNLFFESRSQYP